MALYQAEFVKNAIGSAANVVFTVPDGAQVMINSLRIDQALFASNVTVDSTTRVTIVNRPDNYLTITAGKTNLSQGNFSVIAISKNADKPSTGTLYVDAEPIVPHAKRYLNVYKKKQ